MTGLEHILQDATITVAVPLNESNNYWSSSEYSQNYAYSLNTGNGDVNYYDKGSNNLVRAFRRLPRTWSDLRLRIAYPILFLLCVLNTKNYTRLTLTVENINAVQEIAKHLK